MLDNFREWVSDNLRYILLGLAGILLLVIAFFAVRLISSLGSPRETEPEAVQVTEASTENETAASTDARLVSDQADILEWATQFYTARANKDYDTLAGLCETFDETARASVEAQDALVESYSNIMTYSKPGLTEGSYYVYVYFDATLTDIATPAPSLREFYLITNEEGNLVWANNTSDEQQALIEQYRTDDDVQALVEDVNTKYQQAIDSDEALKNLLESGTSSGSTSEGDQTGESESGTTEDGSAVTGTQTGTMQTTTTVNVRGTPSADGTLYGVVTTGTTVEVLENLDSGWSQIRYTTNGTTIEGYVMTQYLTSAG
ncbi:MAG TPA: SH3 domain-containing protein [Candidatus Choladousia intestinipullorum]|nr:SH3 domain-containing protein [Candidatus Choladousia intestinipullorum]